MDAEDPQDEAGPEEGGKLQKAPKISGIPPRHATGCIGKATVHRTTRPESQGNEFAQGMWKDWCAQPAGQLVAWTFASFGSTWHRGPATLTSCSPDSNLWDSTSTSVR